MPQLINVTYRLPVSIGKTVRKNPGGLLSTLMRIEQDHSPSWVGWPGRVVSSAHAQETRTGLVQQYDYHPVFLSKKEVNGFYSGFSNSTLWPVLHYMPQYMHFTKKWWHDYETVNRRFAETIVGMAEEDAHVWVHDYQLMLLPALLREALPDLRIGYFLHTPFPSYELFRCLPYRETLMRGLLGADQIGFHTFGYLRHFRSTLLRLLELDSEMDCVLYGDRRVFLGVYPIGIDSKRFKAELATKRHAARVEALKRAHPDKTIVLSVERLDYSKGISRRLKAIDHFLSQWREKNDIVFLFISVPSRGGVAEYRMIREQIEAQIGQINGRHSTVENVPLHAIFKSVSFTDLCALYAAADVGLVTPLVDGMNLVAKEFIACKQEHTGTLILSEFAGAAQELFNAITVNPYDVYGMADAIETAVRMAEATKKERMSKMYNRVTRYDAGYWVRTFLGDLATRQRHDTELVSTHEQFATILSRFTRADSTACFIDYDGTLREFEQEPSAATPMPEICNLLCGLVRHPRIDVYLISGRKRREMEEWFGNLGVTLIAEHGLVWRTPGARHWTTLSNNVDLSWKHDVESIMRYYEGTTPGSSVEKKHSSVVWHYRPIDPEFGRWKARQLLMSLYEMTANMPVEIHHGKNVVEIVSVHVNKGAAVHQLLKKKKYDLVVCAGDDITDESMFRTKSTSQLSIKIGPGETEAQFRIANPEKFRKLLDAVLENTPWQQ